MSRNLVLGYKPDEEKMTREEKQALSREMLANMDLTKEQYLNLCALCDELELEPKPEEIEEKEESWDDILK